MTSTQEIQQDTIKILDPWMQTHRAEIAWMPEPLVGLNAVRDNSGMTEIAWDDECPVQWELDPATKVAQLHKKIRSFKGDIEMVVQATRVGTIEELEPGTYVILRRTTT